MSSPTHTLHNIFEQLIADVPTVQLHATPPAARSSQTILDDLDEPGVAVPDEDADDTTCDDGTDIEPRQATKRKATRDLDLVDPDDDDPTARTSSQTKKEHHNTHTRRCRERLNLRFESLLDMLPKPAGNEVKHKVQILDHAISVFTSLQRENVQLQFAAALLSPAHTRHWINGFAMGAANIVEALAPLLELLCTRKKWVYAEVWSLKNGPDRMDCQTMSVDYFTQCTSSDILRRCLLKLGMYMKQKFVCNTRDDYVGKVFESYQVQWSNCSPSSCTDNERIELLQECGMRTCLVIPVTVNGAVKNAIALYDIYERVDDRAMVQFALFAATTIGNCFGAAQQKQPAEMKLVNETPQTPRPPGRSGRLKAS